MQILVQTDADAAAAAGAKFIADRAREAILARGRFVLAVSGGREPWRMFQILAGEPLPWNAVQVFQVDERVAPADDPDRNLVHLRESLLSHAPVPTENIHAMPVEEKDLEAAAAEYSRWLRQIAGSPPVLDLVHLGLGPDGHAASLIPGDKVLEAIDKDVAVTGTYQGHRRMTLTYPILNRARCILWLVTGSGKAEVFRRLCSGDASIPAGLVSQNAAVALADLAAARAMDLKASKEISCT